ncbi:MAG: ribonuclease J [Myxococcaceae bacterium]|jgi:ribonuclease J|nr:ribonuclease J [Myxococcaceae bacterium]
MLKVTPLGGLGQVGLNAMVLEHGAERVLVDCGVLFPRPDQLGIDVVVPDFTALRDEPERLKAVVLTHAHEDHLGALPVLLREFPVPVYGTPFTLALARHRLEESGLSGDLRAFGPGEAFRLSEAFTVEPVQVTHSVPDAVGLWVKTPSATAVHSGDFKLDLSPIDGRLTDLARLGVLGEQGVDLLLSDSTNAENDGWTPSEALVRDTFERLFRQATGRIVVAQFGSHLHRVQHLLRLARVLGRQVVLSGRSLSRNADLARQVGRLEVPEGLLVSLDAAAKLPRERVLVISTGAQAEARSGLSWLASDEPGPLRLEPGDLVVISARAIPGNEPNIALLVNQLYAKGVTVVTPTTEPGVHVSGHAARAEQRRLVETVRPKSFVPVHGELRHLHRHRQTAVEAGVDEARARVATNGDVLGIDASGLHLLGRAPVGQWPMRREGLAPVSAASLAERRRLAEAGLVIAVVVMQQGGGKVLHGPVVSGQGLSGEEQAALPLAAEGAALELKELSHGVRGDDERVREAMAQGVRRVFKQLFGSRPFLHPVVVRV